MYHDVINGVTNANIVAKVREAVTSHMYGNARYSTVRCRSHALLRCVVLLQTCLKCDGKCRKGLDKIWVAYRSGGFQSLKLTRRFQRCVEVSKVLNSLILIC